MPKLAKNCYYDKDGNKKINCYMANIPKSVVGQTNITEFSEIKVYSQGNKIIIEKA